MKKTTKACHYCGHTVLREYRSLNQKQCDRCHKWMDWHLDPGQAPLVGSSRDNGYRGVSDGKG